MDRSIRFISRVLLSKPSNARFILALRDGPKYGEDIRKFRPQDIDSMEFLAIVKREQQETGVEFSLSEKGMGIAEAFYNLIEAVKDCLPEYKNE